MEIHADDSKNTEVDTNNEFDAWSESGDHEGFYNDGPETEETLSL